MAVLVAVLVALLVAVLVALLVAVQLALVVCTETRAQKITVWTPWQKSRCKE